MNGTKVSVYWHDSAWVVKDTNGKTEHRDTAILRDVTFNYNGTVCAGEAIGILDSYVPPPADSKPLRFDGSRFIDGDRKTLTSAKVVYLCADWCVIYMDGDVEPPVSPIAEPIKAAIIARLVDITSSVEAKRIPNRVAAVAVEPPKGVLTDEELKVWHRYYDGITSGHMAMFRIILDHLGEHRHTKPNAPKNEDTNFPIGFCFYLTSNENAHNYGDNLVIAARTSRNEKGFMPDKLITGNTYEENDNTWRAATANEIAAAILKLDATGLIAMAQKLPDLILPIVFKLT